MWEVTWTARDESAQSRVLQDVTKAGEKGQAALAQEAECEGAWHAGIGNGEGGVAQLSRYVNRGCGGNEGEAWVQGVVRGDGI